MHWPRRPAWAGIRVGARRRRSNLAFRPACARRSSALRIPVMLRHRHDEPWPTRSAASRQGGAEMSNVVNIAENRFSDTLSQQIAALGVELSALAVATDPQSMERFKTLSAAR